MNDESWLLGSDIGDKGSSSVEEELKWCHDINERLSAKLRRVEDELEQTKAELKAAEIGEKLFRGYVEKGESAPIWKRVYVAIFAPSMYGN